MSLKIKTKEEEILLSDIAGLGRIDLYTRDITLNSGQQKAFEEALLARSSGVPLQYILGKTEFYGLPIMVEPGVFIPRPETEVLVEAVVRHCEEPRRGDEATSLELGDCFASLRSARNDVVALDLCTGSGCIAICLAKYAKCGKIVAIDISEKSIEIARKNAVLNNVSGEIEFKQADLFEGLVGRFDIIVCNPPYIKRQDLKSLPREVSFDPVIALDGGEDGLDFYRKIKQFSPGFLNKDGVLAMELGDGQAQSVKEMFSGKTEIIKDLNGIERVLIWTR